MVVLDSLITMNAEIPDDSWRVLQSMRPNVLVIDPDADHRDLVVDAVLEGSRAPLWRCDASHLDLPPEQVGTLLLDGVDGLDAAAQRQLLAWMERNRATQIIAVAPRPVYP